MEFHEWLMQKFLDWEKTQSSRQSFSAFARYLGIKVSTVTQWRIGNNPPSYEMAVKIAEKLGDEVFTVLGYDPPGGLLGAFPAAMRLALLGARDTIISRGLAGDSPEAEKIVIDAMIAAGYKLIVTNDDSSTN